MVLVAKDRDFAMFDADAGQPVIRSNNDRDAGRLIAELPVQELRSAMTCQSEISSRRPVVVIGPLIVVSHERLVVFTFAIIRGHEGHAPLQAVSGSGLTDSVKNIKTDSGALDEHS